MFKKLGILILLGNLLACSIQPGNHHVQKVPDVLIIYADGRMLFRDRYLNQDDVVIYADGYGGERAAVKVRVPVRSDYYRDSIKVERVTSNSVPIKDEYQEGAN